MVGITQERHLIITITALPHTTVGLVIRLNTYTEENSGPNIVDVGAGVSSYNVNVVAKNTRKVGNSRNFGYKAQRLKCT